MLKLHLRSLQLLILFDNVSGDPYGIRTRVAAVKGRCPKPLDEGAMCKNYNYINLANKSRQ